MNTTDRRDEIAEVEAHREEDINHHPRMNTHQEKIEKIEIIETEKGINGINIGINQMKIRTATITLITRPLPELTITVNE